MMMNYSKLIYLLVLGIIIFNVPAFSVGTNTEEDPAEKDIKALYRIAKQSIYRKDWEAAVRELRKLTGQYNDSRYQDDALYWLGYSLDKLGNSFENISKQLVHKKEALSVLDTLQSDFPGSNWLDEAGILKVEIAEALVQKGFGEYKKFILNRAQTGADAELKIVALDALAHMDKDKAFPLLEKMLLHNDDPVLRRRTLLVLAQLEDPRVLPLLKKVAVEDNDREVRYQAVFWMGQTGGAGSVKLLMELLDHTSGNELKSKIVFSLSQLGGAVVMKKLTEVAANRKEAMDVRKNALFWLGQTKTEEPGELLELMIRLYSSIVEPELKERIIFSIAQTGGHEGSEALIGMYGKEKDLNLKKRLILGLQQIGDRRAMEFFQDILEK